MVNRPYRLTAKFIEAVKEPGRYGDGHGGNGLSLLVKNSSRGGSKSWCQRLPANTVGKREIGLGRYPEISLSEARDLARRNFTRGLDGETVVSNAVAVSRIPTFADAIDPAMEAKLQSGRWTNARSAQIFQSTLKLYAVPTIGHKSVADITSADVLAVVAPISVATPEQGKRTKESISTVMKWAVLQGYRSDNPVNNSLAGMLPKRAVQQHFKALPYADVAGAIERVRGTEAYWSTKAAFEFIVYTACRSGEVRKAEWSEIDGDVWTIPAHKMKNRQQHRVPLTGPALAVLEAARERTGGAGLIFPSQRGKPMTDSTLSKLLRTNGVGTTAHGLRSSVTDWAAEKTEYPREIRNFVIAHIEGSDSELAYRRTDYFDKRRELLERWAAYLT